MNRINQHFIVYEELPSYREFYEDVMKKNICCLFSNKLTANWRCRREWIEQSNGNIDIDKLNALFGSNQVPVYNCSQQYYNSNPCTTMTFSDYCQQFSTPDKKDILYLKDWHLFNEIPEAESWYEVPVYFESDYLNKHCLASNANDYRFVYIGPKHSSTPLHVDVFGSYSWSANVSGQKKWLMIPPSKTQHLKSLYPHLPADLYQLDDHQRLFETLEAFEIYQNAGEVLFVPSGYMHQVLNLEDTISINHNWFNACNLMTIYRNLLEAFEEVQHELADIRDQSSPSEWYDQCQQVLLIHFGMNMKTFVDILSFMDKQSKNEECNFPFRQSHDSTIIANLLQQIEGNSYFRL